MPTEQLGGALRHICDLAADKGSDQTDAALLRAFVTNKDHRAFEALLRRHGPMVLRVCRRTLGHAHDAEDALQATFLVLARKAASIQKRESLASWLHGVAYRMATDARRAASRRYKHESRVSTPTPSDPALTVALQELQVLLDEAIAGLPEALRAPFICCLLENKSSAEAAQQLGLKEATVRNRLTRARRRLQEGLSRRGVSLTAVLAAAVLGTKGASAALPRSLVVSTAQAAASIAADHGTAHGLVSTKVTALMECALKARCLIKLKTAGVVLLTLTLVVTGISGLTFRTPAATSSVGTPDTADSATPAAGDAFRIATLVQQLGSGKLNERDKATRELDTIGTPALNTLRKAAGGNDSERQRRAEELIRKIEGRLTNPHLPAPKRVWTND